MNVYLTLHQTMKRKGDASPRHYAQGREVEMSSYAELRTEAKELWQEATEPRAFVTHSHESGRAFASYKKTPREFYGPAMGTGSGLVG